MLEVADEIGPNTTVYGGTPGRKPLEWTCTVEDGRTTRVDVDGTR